MMMLGLLADAREPLLTHYPALFTNNPKAILRVIVGPFRPVPVVEVNDPVPVTVARHRTRAGFSLDGHIRH